jgi:hypothetical protein
MYGIPSGMDLSFFNERTLIQVCIGAHDLILNFDGGVSVAVTSSVALATSAVPYHRQDDFREAASCLVRLIDRKVESAGSEGAGTLRIRFAGDDTLYIFDDSEQYESYTIKNRERLIIV